MEQVAGGSFFLSSPVPPQSPAHLAAIRILPADKQYDVRFIIRTFERLFVLPQSPFNDVRMNCFPVCEAGGSEYSTWEKEKTIFEEGIIFHKVQFFLVYQYFILCF